MLNFTVGTWVMEVFQRMWLWLISLILQHLEIIQKLVQVGTQTVLEQLPVDLMSKGVIFTDFYSALEEIPEVIEKYFGKARGDLEDKLAAYHTAYFNSAAVLYVPDNIDIEVANRRTLFPR